MSKLPTFLSSFDKLLTGHPIYFTNSLLIVLSAGGEKIFQSVAFKCPKDPDIAPWYGWLFLFAPLFILLVSGMVLNDTLWRVYHGCRRRSEGARLSRSHRCRSFWFTFFRSLIVPSAWLFVSLLDGTYIICSLAPDLDPEKETEETLRIKAFSQMAGWIYLLLVVIIGTVVTCLMRCYDKKTFLELRYAEVYTKLEREELEKKMNERAKAIAEESVNSLFRENLPSKETWDKVTVPNVTEDKNTYYSSLHKWSNQGINSIPQTVAQSTREDCGPPTQQKREGSNDSIQQKDDGTKGGNDGSS